MNGLRKGRTSAFHAGLPRDSPPVDTAPGRCTAGGRTGAALRVASFALVASSLGCIQSSLPPPKNIRQLALKCMWFARKLVYLGESDPKRALQTRRASNYHRASAWDKVATAGGERLTLVPRVSRLGTCELTVGYRLSG